MLKESAPFCQELFLFSPVEGISIINSGIIVLNMILNLLFPSLLLFLYVVKTFEHRKTLFFSERRTLITSVS